MALEGRIELDRRFVDFDPKDIEALSIASLGGYGERGTQGWKEILCSRCVVILGEPGSGKTTEVSSLVDAVRARGDHAFYRTVSELFGSEACPLGYRDQDALDCWRASHSDGLFVLDSLDEARLAQRELVAALDRLKHELHGEWERVRVVITCRPGEWNPDEDPARLAEYFPPTPAQFAPDRGGSRPSVDAPLVARRSHPVATDGDSPAAVRVVRMAVLTEEQIIKLAEAKGARDVSSLRSALRSAGAWALFDRPMDVTWLVDSWNRRGRIGTLTELVEDSIGKRLGELAPSRRKRAVLQPNAAIEAARTLALHCLLCSQGRVRPGPVDAASVDGAIDVVAALPAMRPNEVAELLESALFVDDGPGGARRFHHRTTAEYLAAQALVDCFADGPRRSALTDFLVVTLYGRRVVPPSLRAIAGWAAARDDGLRRALLEVDPLLLLQAGDPAAISAGERRGALGRILAHLDERPWLRAHADPPDLARFACPELCDLISDRLHGPHNAGTDLVLRLVWRGRLGDNAADALRVAADGAAPDDLRRLALRAAAAAGDESVRRAVIELVTGGPNAWWEGGFAAADVLYPDRMTTGELAACLLAWARAAPGRARQEVFHWTWMLDHTYDPGRHEALVDVLGPALLNLARGLSPRRGTAGGDAVRLASILRALLVRRMAAGPPPAAMLDSWAPWVWAMARVDSAAPGLLARGVDELLQGVSIRRAVIGWLVAHRVPPDARDLASINEVLKDERWTLWSAPREDHDWLVEALRAEVEPSRRLAWFVLASRSCANAEEVSKVEELAEGLPELRQEVHARREARAQPPSAHEEELRRENAAVDAEWDAIERRNRDEIVALVAEVRAGTHEGALRFLVNRMDGGGSAWGCSDWSSLAEPFGEAVAEAAREGLKRAWRRFRPELPHQRSNPREVEWFVPVGLTGLNIAFADGLQPADLSAEDVRAATAYAMCEINGFPVWFGELAARRPVEVIGLMEAVLAVEYTGRAPSTPGEVLDRLPFSDPRLRTLVTPVLLRLLQAHPPNDERALDRVLAAMIVEGPDREQLAGLARAGASLAGDDLGLAWWRGLLRVDPGAAASLLIQAARAGSPGHAVVGAVASADWGRADLDVATLGAVVRAAYVAVAPAADVDRPTGQSYPPGARDEAENQRGRLVERLAAIPGDATFRELMALADDPVTSGHRGWFANLAQTRCERDAEGPAWTQRETHDLLMGCQPRLDSPDGLFRYTLNRLEDLRASVERGDFSCRSLLASADEAGIQRFVAHSLRLATHGHCSVVREEEVDRRKKPDIRLHRQNLVVGIEIKRADEWSLGQLREALERQLVGQYLRDVNARHGVLLLVYQGRKPHWPHDGKNVCFEHVISHLGEEARRLADQYERSVEVIAVDCREAARTTS